MPCTEVQAGPPGWAPTAPQIILPAPGTHTRSSLQARGLEGDSGSYSRLIIENMTKHNLSNVSSDAPINKNKDINTTEGV